MPESDGTPARTATSYPGLLWRDIKRRKSEFFVGLLLSLGASCATVWLQTRDGLLERKHFWDGIVTAAVPALGIIVIFALVEVYRAAASLHREAQAKIDSLASSARDTQSDSLTLNERVRILAAQISSFYEGRNDTTPSPITLPMPPTTPREWNDATLNAKRYGRETVDLYLQRFAQPVTSILKELARAEVVDTELNAAYLLDSDSLLGIGSFPARLRALADRLSESHVDAPDVRLEGPDANVFTLRAFGHACEIRVGPIITELAIVGTMTDEDLVMPVATPRHALEFPIVSDLCDNTKPLEPALWFGGDDPTRPLSEWPAKDAKVPAVVQFFNNARVIRHNENGKPDINVMGFDELMAFGERQRQPFHFRFDITYWDAEHKQRWKRTEVLVYEPALGRAFVRPDGRPERLVSGTEGA